MLIMLSLNVGSKLAAMDEERENHLPIGQG